MLVLSSFIQVYVNEIVKCPSKMGKGCKDRRHSMNTYLPLQKRFTSIHGEIRHIQHTLLTCKWSCLDVYWRKNNWGSALKSSFRQVYSFSFTKPLICLQVWEWLWRFHNILFVWIQAYDWYYFLMASDLCLQLTASFKWWRGCYMAERFHLIADPVE